MNYKLESQDRIIKLDVLKQALDVVALLQNSNRYAVEEIHLRFKVEE
ncbi:hypothetical protein [Coxiella-like endosymbiont of Rhipicephalus sanguineus]|nr:hypothetical protein [Coxiella-like endosymbiont of Rhipicephalus sanguineus]